MNFMHLQFVLTMTLIKDEMLSM